MHGLPTCRWIEEAHWGARFECIFYPSAYHLGQILWAGEIMFTHPGLGRGHRWKWPLPVARETGPAGPFSGRIRAYTAGFGSAKLIPTLWLEKVTAKIKQRANKPWHRPRELSLEALRTPESSAQVVHVYVPVTALSQRQPAAVRTRARPASGRRLQKRFRSRITELAG